MNKRKRIFEFYLFSIEKVTPVIIFLIMLSFKSVAQLPSAGVALPLPNLPSANATALGNYGNYPISYTNGTPNISVPLYEIKTAKISLPISLSYHANGIKVTEQATSVGLGWTLNAGGAITRQINDLPDFDYNGYKHKVVVKGARTSPEIGSSPAYLDEMNDEQRYYYGRLSMPVNQNGAQKYDGQPDDFFFNFAGNSGRFILKNTIDSALEASFSTIPFSPVKIQYTEANQGGGDRFTIHDKEGTAYVFGRSVKDNAATTETSHTLSMSSVNYMDQSGHMITAGTASETGTNVTAWFLTEMISADLTDTISFKYSSQYNASNILSYLGKSTNKNYLRSVDGGVFFETASNSSTSEVSTNNINLSEIDYKNGKVVFEYSSRQDRGTYRLSRIRIYQLKGSQFTELKRLNLNQSYFISYTKPSQVLVNSSDNSINSRLRLDGISEEGIKPDGTSVVNPPYLFNYYSNNDTGEIAYLGEYGQDLWGYWNGKANTDLIISNPIGTNSIRVPDAAHMIAGTIKTIQYPTGGLTEFQFEPNQATRTYITSDSTFQSYHLSSIGLYNSTSTDQTFTANQTITANLQFTITTGCSTGTCLQNQPQVYISDITNGGTGMQVAFLGFPGVPPLPFSGQVAVKLVAGHIYRFYFPSPGGLGEQPVYRLEAVLFHAGLISVVNTPHEDLVLTGGLRVTRVINKDANKVILTTKRYNYKLPYYVSGIFTGDFKSVGRGYNFLKYQLPVTGWIHDYAPTLLPYMQTYTENFTVSMAGAADGSIAYQQVEEYQDDQDGNSIGKTVYDFNRAKDDSTSLFSYVRINNSWRRNQLLEQRVYSGSGDNLTLIKDIKNTYADLFPGLQDTTTCITVNRILSLSDFRPTEPGGGPIYDASAPREFEGTLNGPEVWNGNSYHVSLISEVNYRNALTSTITTDYDLKGENPIENQTDYFYGNADHLLVNRTERIKSDQDKITERIIYTTDYNLDQCNEKSYLISLKTTLTNLKLDFDAQSIPVYEQWIAYAFRRWNILGGCLNQPGRNYPQCIVDNNYNQYDQALVNLYNQYGALKAAYRGKVKQAVDTYKQGILAYNNCYNSQLTAAADSVKAVMLMQQNNQILPAEVDASWTDHTTGTEYMTAVNKIAFRTFGNTSLMGKTLLGFFGPNITYSNYTDQPNNYLRGNLNYDRYNTSGNLVSYHKTAGTQGAFLWGYNQQYMTAEATNADVNQIAYTGFEDGVTSSGNWNFSGGGIRSAVTTPGLIVRSGTACYSIGSGAVTSSVPAGTYVVSYWASGPLTVNGASPSVTGNADLRGGQYFEHLITLPAAGIVTVNGTSGVLLDDLRLYPSNAQMKTYTYDPHVGMTSSTDITGNVTYYEYDDIQRLINIRDKDGYIVKHTDFHYKGQ